MAKPLLGLLLGAFLGIFDGLSALFTQGDDPNVRRDILMIVGMGVFKGGVAGIAIGYFARKFASLPLGIVFGLTIGFLLASPVAFLLVQKYYWEIILPGGLVGLIIGYATQKYGAAAQRTAPA